MFGNLGMSEMIIIAGIALVVIGPEKFPEFAKITLRAFRDFRGYWDEVRREMENELKPVKKELNTLSQYNPEDYAENIARAVTSADEEEEMPQEDSAAAEDDAAETPVPPEQDTMAQNAPDGEADDIPGENPEQLDL